MRLTENIVYFEILKFMNSHLQFDPKISKIIRSKKSKIWVEKKSRNVETKRKSKNSRVFSKRSEFQC